MEHEELWSTVIGQPEAVSFLKETASKSPVHAYLFIGPEGAGRRQAAYAFAGSLLVTNSQEDERHLQLAINGQHPDIAEIIPHGPALLVEDAERITREKLLAHLFESARKGNNC